MNEGAAGFPRPLTDPCAAHPPPRPARTTTRTATCTATGTRHWRSAEAAALQPAGGGGTAPITSQEAKGPASVHLVLCLHGARGASQGNCSAFLVLTATACSALPPLTGYSTTPPPPFTSGLNPLLSRLGMGGTSMASTSASPGCKPTSWASAPLSGLYFPAWKRGQL